MEGQMTIFDILPITKKSKCLDCYWQCKGICVCYVGSKYEDMSIPVNGCDCYDPVGGEGGIPSYEELRGRYQ